MSVPVLEAIADAIMHFEDWSASSRSYRNRNPGNLRGFTPGQAVDEDGYRVFATFVEGYQALLDDLRAKVTGDNRHGLSSSSTIYDLFVIYSPPSDRNSPAQYAAFVAYWMSRVYRMYVANYSTIAEVFAAAGQEVPARVERSA